MFRAFALICLMTIALNSCAPFTSSAANAPELAQPTSVQVITPESQMQGNCPVTEPIQDEPARDPNADPFGSGEWYVNVDRSMWAPAQDWQVGGHKVIWIRPQGAQLEITGRRLDGETPPLHAVIPCCYPTGFQVTGLFFPAEGCWEVVGKAGESELRFVVEVAPAAGLVRDEACISLGEAVKQSEAIVAGRVAESEIEGRYVWHEVEVTENWKPQGVMAGYGISVFQDLQAEPRLEKNSRYVLFLQPGSWELLCAQRSVVEIQGEEAIPAGKNPLWPGGKIADLKAEIARLLAVSPSSTAPATGIPPATPPKEPPPTLPPVTDYVVTGAGEGAPARHEAFVLTGEQALEVAVFMNFIRAYNDGRLEEALTWLSEDISISDCDYGEIKVVESRGRSQAVEWLRQRLSEQDRLIVSRIFNENPEPEGRHVIGVEYSRRSNTTLESLGFPEGIKPELASKVVFEAGTALIQAFANGPVGGDPSFCRPER